VGRGEGLVQVHVHDVETHVARSHGTQNRVEIRAVVVEQSSDLVHRRGDLVISSSNNPSVFGLVNMMPATSGPSDAFNFSRSTRPRSLDGTVVTS